MQSLTPNATRKWGKMTVDQMLWHCNQVLGTSLRDLRCLRDRTPLESDVVARYDSGDVPEGGMLEFVPETAALRM